MTKAAYLQERADQQQVAGLLYEREPLTTVIKKLGAKAISVPDPIEPYQVCQPLYLGATTPSANSEVPHWHREQTEAYVVMQGEAEVLIKWRWENNGWKRRVLHAGDIILAQPETCHWFRWRSKEGDQALALVFKAPQIPGVGKPPNGKTTCTNGCPHYQRGCVLPDGYAI